MKVKFYKGPYHGKVRDVNIKDFNDVVMVANLKPMNVSDFLNDDPYPSISPTYHAYRVKMMKVYADTGPVYVAPAMHPDGSIFLVYEGK